MTEEKAPRWLMPVVAGLVFSLLIAGVGFWRAPKSEEEDLYRRAAANAGVPLDRFKRALDLTEGIKAAGGEVSESDWRFLMEEAKSGPMHGTALYAMARLKPDSPYREQALAAARSHLATGNEDGVVSALFVLRRFGDESWRAKGEALMKTSSRDTAEAIQRVFEWDRDEREKAATKK